MKERELRKIREEIADSTDLIARYRLRESIDEHDALSEFLRKFNTKYETAKTIEQRGEDAVEADSIMRPHSHFSLVNRRSLLIFFAAVVVILIVGGTFLYHRDNSQVLPPDISEEVQLAMRQSVESGRHAADVVSINGRYTSPITQEEKVLYHVDDHFAKQLTEARRITTYHNKEYWVTLDDGTVVHLNYNSRLIYPEKFGDRRDVILEGEAYFMVAKDRSRPFVVHTPQGDVKVYGTEFNVDTRKDESVVSVVLVSGSISFIPTIGSETMLQPGQELTVVNTQLTVEDIDTTPYVAWNTGLFVFKGSKLEDLMDVLSQWYGIQQVNYADDSLRNIRFSGNLKRYGSIERILEAIRLACDLNIQLSNDAITIKE